MLIVGHKKQIEYLNKILKKKENISHAFLFSGLDKSGKKMIAIEFIKAIQCENSKKEIGGACGHCDFCSRTMELSADYMIIEPDLSDSEKSSEISIKKIREIKKFLSERPLLGRSKIVLIDEAHLMTREAQNALLKLLEEPSLSCSTEENKSNNKIIFLISSNPKNLLDTILSRVVNLRFGPAGRDDFEKELSDEFSKEKKAIDVFNMVGYCPGFVFDFNSNKDIRDAYYSAIDDFFSFVDADINDRFKIAEKIAQSKKIGSLEVLDIWIMATRYALFQKLGIYDLIKDNSWQKSIEKMCSKKGAKEMADNMSVIAEIAFLMGSSNVNQRLALEMLALTI